MGFRLSRSSWLVAGSVVLFGSAFATAAAIPNLFPFHDSTGRIATYNVAGAIDTSNPFFKSLGTNGRACASCHIASAGFGLSPVDVQARFVRSEGTDPIFAPIDGANCPTATTGDTNSHSLLLNNGLIRVFLPVQTGTNPGSITTIDNVIDPYSCAVDTSSGRPVISVYRRPLPTTNLKFLSAVMFDGRESVTNPATGQCSLDNPQTFLTCLRADLAHQAIDATLGHAQASTPPTDDQVTAIVNLELGFFTAQTQDNAAGPLNARGANGGPATVSGQTYYPGINDSLTPGAFNPSAFTVFTPWENLRSASANAATRETIAAGEKIFNTFPLTITAVRGLNDNPTLGSPGSIAGTCTTCHDTPNVGNHSLPVPLDIGTSHVSAYEPAGSVIATALTQLTGLPPLPVYRVNGCADPFTGQTVYTTDPGKALISGQCEDVNRIKGPVLRGLAARAPYFHNGAAPSLNDVVNFYNVRFQMNLTNDQRTALIAFLNSL